MEKIWLKNYPKGVPHEVPLNQYASLVEVYEEAISKFSGKKAFTNMGVSISFSELDEKSRSIGFFSTK